MTYQSIDRFTSGKVIPPNNQAILQHARRSFSDASIGQHTGVPKVKTESSALTVEETVIAQIEALVVSGRQKDITDFFSAWVDVPPRLGEWQLRVNYRRQDNKVVGRSIIATPLTVRSRNIFEKGNLANLISTGYSPSDAAFYYKAAWKKAYVWIDTVKEAVLEMILAFQTTTTLEAYRDAGDPRTLARRCAVPKNPFKTSHVHFLVAIEMAIGIINMRNAANSNTVTSQVPANELN